MCLHDIHGALSIINRTDEIYHELPEQRIKVLEQQKKLELKHATLLGVIGKERLNRRVKEWVLKALPVYHRGIQQEKLEREFIEVN